MLKTIKHETTGDEVKIAQYLTGYATRKNASGIFDAAFVSHVISWQKKNGLTADGIVGKNSWNKIVEKAPTCSTSKNSASAATCALQVALGNVDADGLFGSKTKKAVAAYQTAKGLTADGICGPKTWAAIITGSVAAEKINKCVHYLQWDSRWKSVKYSTHTKSQTIGNSGCGPTAMAQILATWIDPKITPVEVAALAVANGFRSYDSGTLWGFYEFCFKHYGGFSDFLPTNSVAILESALQNGALAVCSMNSNDNKFWTSGGHFITAIGYDGTYIYANDPNKSAAPRKQARAKFQSCMKQAFIFWR